MKCSKCGREIPIDTPPSENWEYYCPECGIEEALKLIRTSNKFYGFEKRVNEKHSNL